MTPYNTIIYMIVKITVVISQPVRMELILRKRIATTIGKTEGWWSGKAMKYLLGYVRKRIFYLVNIERLAFRNLTNERVSFMKLFQVYQNTFMRSKIEKAWH